MVSHDIDSSCFHSLADEMTTLVTDRQVHSALQTLHFCPIVLKGDIYTRADFLTYKRGEKALLIGRNISHGTWKKASYARRLALAVANFRSAIDDVPEKYLAAEEKIVVRDLVAQAAENLT